MSPDLRKTPTVPALVTCRLVFGQISHTWVTCLLYATHMPLVCHQMSIVLVLGHRSHLCPIYRTSTSHIRSYISCMAVTCHFYAGHMSHMTWMWAGSMSGGITPQPCGYLKEPASWETDAEWVAVCLHIWWLAVCHCRHGICVKVHTPRAGQQHILLTNNTLRVQEYSMTSVQGTHPQGLIITHHPNKQYIECTGI